jgi:hypothetical protein
MNEKEAGILGFPTTDGAFDYLGFTFGFSTCLKGIPW